MSAFDQVKGLKCIKMIGNKEFTVGLYESKLGEYHLVSSINLTDDPDKFQTVGDLKLALWMFDNRLQELEGN